MADGVSNPVVSTNVPAGKSGRGLPSVTVVSVPVNDLTVSRRASVMYAISLPPLVHCGETPPLVETCCLTRPEGKLATQTSSRPAASLT